MDSTFIDQSNVLVPLLGVIRNMRRSAMHQIILLTRIKSSKLILEWIFDQFLKRSIPNYSVIG